MLCLPSPRLNSGVTSTTHNNPSPISLSLSLSRSQRKWFVKASWYYLIQIYQHLDVEVQSVRSLLYKDSETLMKQTLSPCRNMCYILYCCCVQNTVGHTTVQISFNTLFTNLWIAKLFRVGREIVLCIYSSLVECVYYYWFIIMQFVCELLYSMLSDWFVLCRLLFVMF